MGSPISVAMTGILMNKLGRDVIKKTHSQYFTNGMLTIFTLGENSSMT